MKIKVYKQTWDFKFQKLLEAEQDSPLKITIDGNLIVIHANEIGIDINRQSSLKE